MAWFSSSKKGLHVAICIVVTCQCHHLHYRRHWRRISSSRT